jgi:hypothetical protein
MVDPWRSCYDNVPVEYKKPEDDVLGLRLALEGFSHEAGPTDLAINVSTLRC